MEFMLVIRDGEWKPCAYFIDGKRISKEAYNIMEYEVQTHGVADCFLHAVHVMVIGFIAFQVCLIR